MNAETVSLLLSGATLVVVATAAVAAIVQLRHLRTSNQLSALLELLHQWNQPALQTAYGVFTRTVDDKLIDPEYVKLLRAGRTVDRESHPEFLVLDLWEQVGTYAKHGLIDEAIVLDIVSAQVLNAWKRCEPVVAILRERGGPATCENFEYLAARSALWTREHADGSYPRGTPRMADLNPRASS